jgi:hypothetical protein
MDNRIQCLVNAIESQFYTRTQSEGRKLGMDFGITMETKLGDSNILWLTFSKEDVVQSITIPMPYEEDGVQLIQQNEVVRSVCPFWMEHKQEEVDYILAMHRVILGDATGIISPSLVKASFYLQQMIYGFSNGNAPIIAYRFQKAINEVVNKMPLHETFMNSYIMNNRLMIVDQEFDEISSPGEKLVYQVNKARKYFDRGWTAIGLSDGTLADKNYLLKTDLRTLSPFGLRYHNPQRNLYSTLGMKGEELPLIRSQSMQNLMDKGITRKGWNWFTAFVDVPDVFEDQIIVDESHANKTVAYERRFQIFGAVRVAEGQSIKTGETLGHAPDGEANVFKVICDSAVVKKVVASQISVGGVLTDVTNVVVSYSRKFRDGLKITNLHGNKGVIRIMKLGYAIDPRTGEHRKIDVIVGAKTVGKRKNYGQIMEAMLNCALDADQAEREPIVLNDDWCQSVGEIRAGLARRGYREDATWDCDTYTGKVKAVCGTVFWGCIKTAEDQIWQDGDTISRNGKEVRTAGLKVSHVEFRALETRFGEENPITDEIMGFAQGSENLNELLTMLRAQVGVLPEGKIELNMSSVKPLDQTTGTIVPGQYIGGTVVDEFFHPEGFIVKLPLPFQTLVDISGEIVHEGSDMIFSSLSKEAKESVSENFTTDRIYIPNGVLRKCWRHDTGRFGLSEIGVIVNNVVEMSHRLMANNEEALNHRLYFGALSNFFRSLTKSLGSKRGEIATYSMAVRYPFSAKAVATLSTTLPKNTVEIHRNMAQQMRVNHGDIVLSERFPCLGFMSVRPQQVYVTDDPMCLYTIRVSGNSLVSQNLDFDGDVVYLAGFQTPAARMALRKEWENPNKTCYDEISCLNSRKGAPHIKEYSLDDFNIMPFSDLTNEEHAIIVEKNTGVKAQTGPVIALTYNIMRIVENSDLAHSQKMKVAFEMFLEKAAQSVFEQKHGGRSLYEVVIDGVCTADVEGLVEVGFKRGTTEKLCNLIVENARSIGIFDLPKFHAKAKKGGSNIISRIVREKNRIYFASRSQLEGPALIKALEEPAVDIPSRMFKWITAGKADLSTILDKVMVEDRVKGMKDKNFKEACVELCDLMDSVFSGPPMSENMRLAAQFRHSMCKQLKEGFKDVRPYTCR